MERPPISVDKEDRDLNLVTIRNRTWWFVKVRRSRDRAARVIAERKLGRKLGKIERVFFANGVCTDLRRLNLVVESAKQPPRILPRILVDEADRDLRLMLQSSVRVRTVDSPLCDSGPRLIAARMLGRKLKPKEYVLQKNRVLTDLRRSNLLITTQGHCQRTTGSLKGSSSQFKGVHWVKRIRRWIASIRLPSGKREHLGCFENEREAAEAYNEEVLKLDLPYAFINKLD